MIDDVPRPADPAASVTVSVRKIAGDWPLLREAAGSPPPVLIGTIGRTSDVHGIPGGTEHHSLARETSDTLADYAERTRDAAGLEAKWSDVDPTVNAEFIAVHAETAADLDPGPCAGHARADDDTGPRVHATVEQHFACLAHRVRLRVEPAGARILVGLCPTQDDDGPCERSLRTTGGTARCSLGHVHDTATVRDLAVAEASRRTHTLADVARMSMTLWGRRVRRDHLRQLVHRGHLVPVGQDDQGRHLVSVSDVAAVVVHGHRHLSPVSA